MDAQDRQDGNYFAVVRDLSLTRRGAQNLPKILDRTKTYPILSILCIHVSSSPKKFLSTFP